jgi:hypothetical protein
MTFLLSYEAIMGNRYDNWKSRVMKEGFWSGGLATVSPDPILMWEYRHNAESSGAESGVLHKKIKTNRYGFRDKDNVLMDKPLGTYRFSFIGDSVTLGFKVDIENVFTNKFATYAANQHPNLKIESLNHGIDGYNTLQIFELLKTKVLNFQPDDVVYVMCLNDFDFDESSGAKSRYFRKPGSFLLEKVQHIYRDFLHRDFHLWHFSKNKQQVFNTIVEMHKLLVAKGIGFHVVVVPVFSFENHDDSFSAYPLSEMHLEIAGFLGQQKIHFIDLFGFFKNAGKPPSYFAHDNWHPNKEGHDLIASHLVEFLLQKS